MEQPIVVLQAQTEAIARYLGRSYPSACIRRYEDPGRGVVGFRFFDETHGDVEFSRQLLETFPKEENAIALELHLLHAGAAISLTHNGERLIFETDGVRREPT